MTANIEDNSEEFIVRGQVPREARDNSDYRVGKRDSQSAVAAIPQNETVVEPSGSPDTLS